MVAFLVRENGRPVDYAGACHVCIHSRTLPGNTHLRCAVPPLTDRFMAINDMFNGNAASAAESADLKAEPHGVDKGWFSWPIDFDPAWLRNCNLFEARGGSTEVVKSESEDKDE